MEYKVGFAHYGEEREINANKEELMIAEHIQKFCPTSRLVRVSDAYVTIKCVNTDVARFKFTDRAKWIQFPYLANGKKRYFTSLQELSDFDDAIRESYQFASKTDGVN